MLRAAVIGCGSFGTRAHIPAYETNPDTDLVALRDLETRPLTAFLDEFEPELVSLCTPDATHDELLEEILNAPCVRGVLCEKPLAGTAKRAERLTAMARERGVVLAVNYTRRFVPELIRLASEIKAGHFGEIQHVHGTYYGGLRHNGTHWLDLLRMMAGEVVAVRGWDRLKESGADCSLDAELVLVNDAGARLAALDAKVSTLELDLIGTKGRVRLVDSGHRIERWTVSLDERYPGDSHLVLLDTESTSLLNGTQHAIADLVRCVNDGGEPWCSGREATEALRITDAIAASAITGRGLAYVDEYARV